MNLDKLKQAEETFFEWYPGGFENPAMVEIGKKHKMDKMISFTKESFSKTNFNDPEMIVNNTAKIISRASMVSVFEKPRFRDFINAIKMEDKKLFSQGMYERLYGNEQNGFKMILDVLLLGKLAKWSLISICPLYFNSQFEVFVKPTTAKGIVKYFEIESLEYKPKPSWEFYKEFRYIINEMKNKVDPSLSPNNAAFTGFLMMTMEKP